MPRVCYRSVGRCRLGRDRGPDARGTPHSSRRDRRQRTHHAGWPPRIDHQRQYFDDGGTPNPHRSRWHRQREAEPLQLHGRVGRAPGVSRAGVSLEADPRHRGRARRGPGLHARQRHRRTARRGVDQRRWAPLERYLAAAAAMAGQRRRVVDSDCTRVGIPCRFGRTHCHEPESGWRCDVRRGPALPVDQGRGNRRRGRSSTRRCRDPDQSRRDGIDRASAAWMLGQPPAARLQRARDLRAGRASWPEQGVDARIHESHQRTRVPGRPVARHGRHGRTGVHHLG